jgi:hypothetical protein
MVIRIILWSFLNSSLRSLRFALGAPSPPDGFLRPGDPMGKMVAWTFYVYVLSVLFSPLFLCSARSPLPGVLCLLLSMLLPSGSVLARSNSKSIAWIFSIIRIAEEPRKRVFTRGEHEGHDRIANSVGASGKEAARVSLPKIDRSAL